MSTPSFKYGNGVWATKEGSSLAYNDDNGHYKPLPFSVSRASSATRVNKQGLIEVVGNDRLRIDYSESTKGVALLEPSRSNIIPSSEDLDTGWSKARVNVSNNEIISPDGTQSAAKVTEDTTASTSHTIYDTLSGSVTAGNEYYLSCFVKKGTRRFIQFREGYSNAQLTLDTSDFSVFSFTNGTDYNVENYGNGWYRIEFGFTADSSGNSQFACYFLDDSKSSIYTGDGSSYAYLWGAQIEAGSYATSYIPTSGSTATRQADVANGAGVANVFNDSEGVLFADIAALTDADTSNRYVSLSNGSLSNSVMIQYRDSGEFRLYNGGTGASNLIYRDANADLTDNVRVALKYGNSASNYKVYINGFEGTIDGSFVATTISGLNQLEFDYPISSLPFYGKAKAINVYQTALTDAELEYLTSYRSLAEMATELNLNAL